MIFQLHKASCPQASLGRGNSGQAESLSDGPSGAQPLPESLYLPTKAASRVSLGLGQLLSSSFPRPPFSAQAHNPRPALRSKSEGGITIHVYPAEKASTEVGNDLFRVLSKSSNCCYL